MATDIIMPQLGESIAEGTIIRWIIPCGGRVEKDQSLLEVETDKVALEIPSPASGILSEILIQEGEKVPVGTLLGRLDTPEAATGIINRVGGVILRPTLQEGTEHYSPAVRQLAKEHGVDLAQIVGTGAGGRITKHDVLEFVAKAEPTSVTTTPSSPSQKKSMGERQEEIVPFTTMRKTIAERMVKSRQTSAHVVTFFEVNFSEVAEFRKTRDLTYLPFVINAVARAIKHWPILNSSWEEQGIKVKHDLNIGIAVALEDGLLVPVVRNADRKRLTQLAQEVADLAERARTKQLKPEEVQGGTFTITNHGGFGSLLSAPIINQPEIAILGVGAVQKRAVVINDAIAIRPMSYLSLSFDHRVIDGATADRFMAQVKTYLEESKWETFL